MIWIWLATFALRRLHSLDVETAYPILKAMDNALEQELILSVIDISNQPEEEDEFFTGQHYKHVPMLS